MKQTLNEQLHIPQNGNMFTRQQDLYVEDWSQDLVEGERFFNTGVNYGALSSPLAVYQYSAIGGGTATEKWSNAGGIALKACQAKCNFVRKAGGRRTRCFEACVTKYPVRHEEQVIARSGGDVFAGGSDGGADSSYSPPNGGRTGPSSGAKVGIVVGILALAGLGFYLYKRSKN